MQARPHHPGAWSVLVLIVLMHEHRPEPGDEAVTLPAWERLELLGDPHEPEHLGDPGALVDAAGRILEALRPPQWTADAACLEHPELTWFPTRGEDVRLAKAVCAACLVREECLEFAMARHERHGVWGGLSERQRRGLRVQHLR